MKKGIFLSLLLIASQSYSQNYEIHVLKEGETLSEILQKRGYSPLYGEDQWVDKTLKMNHLASPQAKEIKKGFPIILPSKDRPQSLSFLPQKPHGVISQTIQKNPNGFFAGLISEHQDVFVQFAHDQNTMTLNTAKLNQKERFSLGLHVEGNNDYQLGDLLYNYHGGFDVQSQGTGNFSDSSERSANFAPTYNGYLDLRFKSDKLNFEFGPTFDVEERTRLALGQNNNYNTRRDQTLWLGFEVSNRYHFSNSRINFNLGMKQNFIQRSLNGMQDFSSSQIYASSLFQLTQNYFAGLHIGSTEYGEATIENERTVGINFRYLVR